MLTHIVIFWFMDDWGLYGRAYEKIAEALAARPEIGRVICVLPPDTAPKRKLSWPFKFRKFSRKLIVLKQVKHLIHPVGAPYRLRSLFNKVVPEFAFRAILKILGFSKLNTRLWLYPPHPYIDELQKLIPHDKVLVHIVDNNTYMEGTNEEYRNFSRLQYESLVAAADEVIVSSEENYRIFSKLNPRCYKFENAVDRIFLAQASDLPSRTNHTRPRLGYVGWITERTDLILLIKLARIRPEYDIFLAGPLGRFIDLSEMLTMRNISWLGPLSYTDIPAFLSSLDICLIPHKDTSYSRSMNPLKLFQYLGSGRPIVTTRIAGTERWSEHICIANNYDEFIEAVDESLRCESLERSKARIRAASLETWDHRVAQIISKVSTS